jgi:putative hydrolase of the HAD superfamily
VLLTKGREEEQLQKLRRSGISGLFSAVEVVSEKEVRTYLAILEKYQFDISRTWMIGNSPKSDINPALSAGLQAILIPHDRTWVLEHEDLPGDNGRFRVLEGFSLLRQLF